MSEDNKAIARRFFEIFSEGNTDALEEILAADAADHDPYNPHADEGLEGAKKTIAMYREAFPDIHFDVELQLADGDMVATRWSGTGTHKGALMGVEPTGAKTTTTGIGIDRIEDGKIVESWNSWDTLGLMNAIGAIPQAEAART